jgi:putative transposase
VARQPRLIVPGLSHLVRQRGHNAQPIARDAQDRHRWIDTLREAASTHQVAIQGWCIEAAEFRLLAKPAQASSLSRMLQDIGRRYVGAFNTRHGRSGTLWGGRFQCAAVEPGAWELVALASVEQTSAEPGDSSAAHHLGERLFPWLDDPAGYWALGNTPFERQARWRRRLEQGLGAGEAAAVERALRSGIPLAGAAWLAELQPLTSLRLFPRPRGRPPRQPGAQRQ